jgi:hypothetical protein
MKQIVYSCLLLFFSFSVQAKNDPDPIHKAEPRATFDKIWVDYDITEDGARGMRVHVKFSTYEMKGTDAYLAIYFETESGTRLKDNNDKFNSTDGDVAVYRSIKPVYDPADYNDLQVFMPYNELDRDPGEYELRMDVDVIYKAGGLISHLTYHNFEYSKPASGGTNTSSPSAKFENMWVDYDITENGRKGMRIHVKGRTYNLKGVDCYLAIYFEKENGEILKTENTDFRSKNGQVAIYKLLTPGYTETVYDDLKLFMPYAELNLGTGKHDLTMDVDIIYKNGDLIKHLKYYDFWYEK